MVIKAMVMLHYPIREHLQSAVIIQTQKEKAF